MSFGKVLAFVFLAVYLTATKCVFAQSAVPRASKAAELKPKAAPKVRYEPKALVNTYGQGTVTADTFFQWIADTAPPELFDGMRNSGKQWLIQADVNAGWKSITLEKNTLCHIHFTIRLWPMDSPFGGQPLGANVARWPFYGLNTVVEGPGGRDCESRAKEALGEALLSVSSQLKNLQGK